MATKRQSEVLPYPPSVRFSQAEIVGWLASMVFFIKDATLLERMIEEFCDQQDVDPHEAMAFVAAACPETSNSIH